MSVRLPKPTEKRPRYPLRPWAVKLAFLLVEAPTVPTLAQQLEAANRLANVGGRPDQPPVVITLKQLRTLRSRPDFQQLVTTLAKEGREGALAKLQSLMPEYMGIHVAATRRAMEKEDLRAVASLTAPILERIAPKRGTPFVGQQINITLSDTRRALLESDRPILEAEVVSPEAPEDAPDSPRQLPSGFISFAEALRIKSEREKLKPADEDALRDAFDADR